MHRIIHIDMDAFYAAVEIRDNPSLRGKPVAVGGTKKRGVISTASYEARKYGVHSALPVKTALRLCPSLICLPVNMKKYIAVSKQIFSFFKEYTPILEGLSLDECYLDVSSHKLPATEIAKQIKNRIREEVNLTASAGVAPNKLIAKIASDLQKPDGLVVIKPAMVSSFMAGLSVKKLWGVGRVTAEILDNMGVKTCADLQEYPKEQLVKRFGKYGSVLYYFCRGIDDREVSAHRESKSIGSENTFGEDVLDKGLLKEEIVRHVKGVYADLSFQNLYAKTLSLKVTFSDFKSINRSASFDFAIKDEEVFIRCALSLFDNLNTNQPIRLIGVSLKSLTSENVGQPLLPFA